MERSDNEIILPINLRPASQNWDAGLKNQMRGPDNKGYHEEKDSRDSSKKSCRMLQTKIDTPQQKKITQY